MFLPDIFSPSPTLHDTSSNLQMPNTKYAFTPMPLMRHNGKFAKIPTNKHPKQAVRQVAVATDAKGRMSPSTAFSLTRHRMLGLTWEGGMEWINIVFGVNMECT
jgi:hypothetical protein